MYAYVKKDTQGFLIKIELCDEKPKKLDVNDPLQKEIERYFKGELRSFTYDVRLPGTPFQQAVYQATMAIPYGQTRSYGEIAKKIGKPKAARAVGQALNKNPYPVLIPCHRVIGHDDSLVGFGQKLSYKRFLLRLENQYHEELV